MKNQELTGLEVAVIGMALKFPGAENPQQFWDNLRNGRESVKFFTSQELDALGIESSMRNNPAYVPSAGGQISAKEFFDASFFGYTPEEAILMDPQTRLFHEISWKAIEDSGYDVTRIPGRVGLYAGSSNSFYWEALTELSGASETMGRFAAMQLSSKDFLASKISYKFNLKGPSVPVQTACSTSLVAVHLATRALLLGECDMALAGGVTVATHPEKGYIYQEGMILSRDGHCRSFDAEASGTIAANGAGVVVLKLLRKALEDKDHIYAVIKGSAINNDGDRKTGYTAPSVKGQVEVIRAAMNFARVEPESIQYVECHGTATTLGDPIEIEALRQAYQNAPRQSCAIGCVKSNMGHLDSAAGIAGLIKAVLSLKNKQLPPSINYTKPNPAIDFSGSPFYVNTVTKDWETADHNLRRAAVSSFGIGGTNAHVVLEEAPSVQASESEAKQELIVISAKTEASLEKNTLALLDFFKNEKVNLTDVAYTLLTGRNRFPYRRVLVASHNNISELTTDDAACRTFHSTVTQADAIFLFPGGGSQYVNMARGLYDTLPYFRQIVDEGNGHLQNLTGLRYLDHLYPEREDGLLEDTEIALPLLFMVSYGLALQLQQWGLKPKAMIGHSLGEYVAACVSGVFSYPDALKIVLTRGRLMKKVGEGLMLNISSPADTVRNLLLDGVSIAAINSTASCVAGGPRKDIEALQKTLAEAGIETKVVHIAVASHSPMMDGILGEFRSVLTEINFARPTIPYVSNITGDWVESDMVNADYWVNHLRHTVQFATGIDTVQKKFEHSVWIEVGPSNILASLVKQNAKPGMISKTVSLIRHPNERAADDLFLLGKLGELWLYGCALDWHKRFDGNARRISLPTYQFDQQRFWIDKDLETLSAAQGNKLAKNKNINEWFHASTWRRGIPHYSAGENKIRHYLLFDDGTPLVKQVGHELTRRGAVITSVVPAETFGAISEKEYRCNFTDRRSIDALCKNLEKQNIKPTHVVFFAEPVDGENLGTAEIRQAQQRAFYPLVNVVKALSKSFGWLPLTLNIVTRSVYKVTGAEKQNVAHATLGGLIKSIAQENPDLAAVQIDIGETASTDQVISLADELQCADPSPVVALRHGNRWLPHFETLPSGSFKGNREAFKTKGVYLFTGGLGRIGFTIMEYLSRVYQATFIITGTTELPPATEWETISNSGTSDAVRSRIEKIKLLQSYGSTVWYRKVAVDDAYTMTALVTEAIQEFSRIDGIVHSAAVTASDGFQAVAEVDDATCERHFKTKVYGVAALHDALRNRDYDFCLLMSSISSTLGGIGFGSYAASNFFLDRAAEQIARATGKRWISVGWDGWEYWEDRHAQPANDGAFKMTVDEGPLSVEAILGTNLSGAIVHSLSDLQKRLSIWVDRKHEHDDKPESPSDTIVENRYNRPALLSAYKAPASAHEKMLADLWATFFKYDRVGVNDNFFELGGNSLKGISLISMINRKFGVHIPIKEFFTRGTIAKLAPLMTEGSRKHVEVITPAEGKDFYPLSSAQLRLYLVQELSRDGLAYNETYTFEINGTVDADRLEHSLRAVMDDHQILRTQIVVIDEQPMQQVLDRVSFDLIRQKTSAEKLHDDIRKLVRPFNMQEPPYFRAALLTLEPARHILVLDVHHLLTDGISTNILLKHLAAHYTGSPVEKPALHYVDYAEWQQKTRNSSGYETQKQFWLSEFDGEIPELDLPIDFPRAQVRSFEGAIEHFSVPDHQVKKLYEIASHESASLYTVLLTAYNIFLSRLTNQDDIVIGSPSSGRPYDELKDMIGMFVNTVPLRNTVDHTLSFSQLLAGVKDRTLAAFDNQNYQYEQLVEDLKLVRNPARNPLFDAVFTFQNMESSVISVAELAFKPYNYTNAAAKFDFLLAITEDNQKLSFAFNYSTALFRRETVQRFAEYFGEVIAFVVQDRQRPLNEMEIVPRNARKAWLDELDSTSATYSEITILGKFEEQVKKFPARAALTYEGVSYTYAELDARATQVAIALQQSGVQPNSIVSVFMGPCAEVVWGILGVLKAGCAYLPVDIHYPEERVQYILADSQASFLLTTSNDLQALNTSCSHLLLDDPALYTVALATYLRPANRTTDDLLYIIYTSGTTGRPKGAMITHRNVVRLLFNSRFQFTFTENDVWTLYHSHAFDFSVWEMYGALLYGARLVVVPKMVARDTASFVALAADQQVTVLNQTPTAFYNFIKEALVNNPSLALRYVIFGGEALAPAKLKQWAIAYPSARLINMYGITETTVHVTFKEITKVEIDSNVSNIGKPIPTLSLLIVNKNLKLQPPGVSGELCVSGDGVALGYLNRAELTIQRFVNNPYRVGEKMYRSGDLARMLPNGEIEYLGRMDNQVKIRGYRIELGEIEYQALQVAGITDTVVIVIDNTKGEKSLCLYFVSPADIQVAELRSELQRRLPDYMVPSYFVQIAAVPLTNHGKINQKALPAPVAESGGVAGLAPRNAVERKLVDIWRETLEVDNVSITSSFFHLGGDSIKAIRLVNNINRKFSSGIKLADLYVNETIEKLSVKINEIQDDAARLAMASVQEQFAALRDEIRDNMPNPEQVEDIYPMTEIELGMVFNYMKNLGTGVYHDQFLFNLTFTEFNVETFEQALTLLMRKHPILRTGFNIKDFNKPVHIVYTDVKAPLEYLDYTGTSHHDFRKIVAAELSEDLLDTFDDRKHPLWRMKMLRYGITDYTLVLTFHHAVLDGWSVASMMTELNNTYYALIKNPAFTLPPLRSSYKDAVIQEHADKQLQHKLDYWRQELTGYQRLDLSFLPSAEKQGDMQIYKRKLDRNTHQQLVVLASDLGTSLKNLLFSAYLYTLKAFSSGEEVIAGWVTNNRPVVDDGDKILGCFLNTVPVRVTFTARHSWADYIRMVDQKLRELKEYETVPLFEIAKAIGERSRERNPIFDTLFNFVNFHIYNDIVSTPEEGKVNESFSDGNQNTNTLFDFEVSTTGDEMFLLPKYDTVLIPGAFVSKFCDYYVNVLARYIANTNETASVNAIIPVQEAERILMHFNDSVAAYDRDVTMAEIVERQALKTPQHIALEYAGQQWTYGELNHRANQLACSLRSEGVGRESLVGIWIERSPEMIVSMLAIVKAGGAYVPMELNLPDARIARIVNDLEISTILCSKRTLERFSQFERQLPSVSTVYCLDAQTFPRATTPLGKNIIAGEQLGTLPGTNPECISSPDDVAYIIFTSGSTGVPKGVVVKHRPVINIIEWVNKTLAVSPADKLLFVTSIGFDLSVYDVFGMLAAGGTIRLMDYEELGDPKHMLKVIGEEGITIWDSAPAAIQVLVPLLDHHREMLSASRLRLVMLSGDWIPVTLPDVLRNVFEQVEVVSLGGATEATIWSNYYRIGEVQKHWKSIPYGKPTQNCKYYILNKDLEICPVGVAGDLYIGGDCLSAGYVNDLALTTQKFVGSPFAKGEIIYKTGDLARWFEDGNMEFLGRKDGQVKIRGFRIETGEIESLLVQHSDIRSAVVMPHTNKRNEKYLCAYVVLKDGSRTMSIPSLKEYLLESVPDYFVPESYVFIDEIPVSANGKVDRKRLPEPETASATTVFVAPANAIEEQLGRIWCDVLGVEQPMSAIADFFEMGGHSLSVTALIAQIQRHFKVELSIREIFSHTTLRAQANLVAVVGGDVLQEAADVEERENIIL
jgi:amino acid adenylation domain-containing protein